MVDISNPVLVVVDMQKGFLNTHSSYIIDGVVKLIHECQIRSIPVVFTRFINIPEGPFVTLMDWGGVSDEPDTDIVDELTSFAQVVITKNFYTSFTEKFSQLATENGWKTIMLCGVSTESCVLKTAADAFEQSLVPIVISDACASDLGDEAHKAGLLALNSLIGKNQILTINSLLERLNDSLPSSTDTTI